MVVSRVEAALTGLGVGASACHGAAREASVRCGDWQIRGEQLRDERSGRVGGWSVYALHKSGARVPPGPNVHADPVAEMARLESVIDWPRSEPRGFSWIDDGAHCADVLFCLAAAE